MLTPKEKYKHNFFRKAFSKTLLVFFIAGAFSLSAANFATSVYAAQADEPAPGRLRGDCENLDNCGIIEYLLVAINILSALVGVIVVIMIVIGGIQYASARDNPQAVAGARERIINALLALVVYLGMTAFLQWIVPGGIFSG